MTYFVITLKDEQTLEDWLNAITTETVDTILTKGAEYTVIYTTP